MSYLKEVFFNSSALTELYLAWNDIKADGAE